MIHPWSSPTFPAANEMSFPKLLVLGFREDSRFMDYDHPQKGARITSHQPSIAHQLPINHPSIKHQATIIFQIYQFHSLFFFYRAAHHEKKNGWRTGTGGTSPRSSNSKGIHSGWFTSSFITGPAAFRVSGSGKSGRHGRKIGGSGRNLQPFLWKLQTNL